MSRLCSIDENCKISISSSLHHQSGHIVSIDGFMIFHPDYAIQFPSDSFRSVPIKTINKGIESCSEWLTLCMLSLPTRRINTESRQKCSTSFLSSHFKGFSSFGAFERDVLVVPSEVESINLKWKLVNINGSTEIGFNLFSHRSSFQAREGESLDSRRSIYSLTSTSNNNSSTSVHKITFGGSYLWRESVEQDYPSEVDRKF